MRILVIEDNTKQQKIAQQLLIDRGHYGLICEDLLAAYIYLDNHTGSEEIRSRLFGKDNHHPVTNHEYSVDWDFAILDLNFPYAKDGTRGENSDPAPFGYEVVMFCNSRQLPCCIHTSTDHHQANSLCASRMCQALGCGYFPDKDEGRCERTWVQVMDYAEKFERKEKYGRLEKGVCRIMT